MTDVDTFTETATTTVTGGDDSSSDSEASTQPNSGSGGTGTTDMTVEELRDWLRAWVANATNQPESNISDDRPMEEFGLSSRDAVALSGDIEDKTGVMLTATVAFAHPTIASLATRIIEGEPDDHFDDDEHRYDRSDGTLVTHDIAIVGVSTRFPGGGETPESTWAQLIEGRDGIRDLPEDRWTEFKAVPELNEKLEKANLKGGYLDDVRGFDAEFFSILPREAEMIDPQQRLALELTWEALEHAHIPASELKGGQVGVFIGSSANDYQLLAVADPSAANPYALTGTSTAIIPNRVSYFFDFHGPSIAVDTACSSSLVSIHMGVKALRAGECDVALAGGVNMLLGPPATLGFDDLGVQAPDGKIKAFSSDADGMIRAEGGGMVVLKRVEDARRDGDDILAIIAGSAVAQDGRSNGLPAPNPEAQVQVLRQAYQDAGINPKNVDYIEAHGTGTVLGDPIEAEALGKVVGRGRDDDKPALLGSAKTNYGHLEAAAGVAGVIKVVLALRANKLPPSLNYAGPNPYIQFDKEHLRVIPEAADWPRYSGTALAGVSGNGFGGTVAHVVLREATDADRLGDVTDTVGDEESDEARQSETAESASLENDVEQQHSADPSIDEFAEAKVPGALIPLVVSAFIPSRRRRAAAELADWLDSEEGQSQSLADIGRTLAHRSHLRTRSVVLARTHEEAVKGLRAIAAGKPGQGVLSQDGPDTAGSAWIMSGFGSQHRKMAKQFYQDNPIFAKYFDRVNELIIDECGDDYVAWVLDDSVTYGIETAQIGIFAIQVALFDYLRHHGAEPEVLIGHSMGEASAAYASGGLSMADAVRVICNRSRLMGEGEGMLFGDYIRLMALVEYSADDITNVLDEYPDLEVCVYAAPNHTVVGGPEAQVDAIVARAESEGKLGRKLQTKGASHTAQMDPLLGELTAELIGIEPRKLDYALYSSVNREEVYKPGTSDVHDVDYFVKGLRHSVWFSQAVTKAVEAGHRTFVELSPNPVTLISVAAVTFGLGVMNAELVQTLKRKENENDTMMTAMMQLYVHGHPIDVRTVFGRGNFAPVPRTSFARKPFWINAKLSGPSSGAHLPGAHVSLPDGRHAWELTAATGTDLNVLLTRAAEQVLTDVTVSGVIERDLSVYDTQVPTTLVTTFSSFPGGGSLQVHQKSAGTFTLLLEAAVMGSAKTDDAVVTSVSTPKTVLSHDDTTSIEEPEIVETVGERWDPESGESVEDRLALIVAESMGYAPEDLPREIPLVDLGLDSLMGVRIKNRVEYEFEIPPLQLQTMRDAALKDVVRAVQYAVDNREEVQALYEQQIKEEQGKKTNSDDGAADVNAFDAVATAQAAAPETSAHDVAAKVAENAHESEHADGAAHIDTDNASNVIAAQSQSSSTDDTAVPSAEGTLHSQKAVAAAVGSDVPPRDAAERLTFATWAIVTGKSAGGIFNRLPVLDEDTAEKLADRLSDRAGGESIDIDDLLDCDTIEEMAELVRQQLDGGFTGVIRQLRDVPNATRKPLFLFHPAGGSSTSYQALLRRLPDDIPVYGVERVEGPVEERVRQYQPLIKEVQPEGPYYFAGWSLGGALAYGSAVLFTEQGDEVAMVSNFDLCMPKNRPVENAETKRARLERWANFARVNYNLGDIALPLDRFMDADDEGQFKIVMELLAASGQKIPGGIIEHQRTSFMDNRALYDLQPPHYDGYVVLYRADKMHDGAIELEPSYAEIDPDGGWSQYASNLEVVKIGGDHMQIIDEPYIGKIAHDMTEKLTKLNP